MILLELGLACGVLVYFLPWMPARVLAVSLFTWVLLLRLLVLYTKYSLKISVEEPLLRTFARDRAEVVIRVENRGWLPADLVWTDSSGELEVFGATRGILTLGSKKGFEIRYQVRSPVRGLFSLGPALVRLKDPLGLFPSQLESRGSRELLVYPPWASRFPAGSGISGGLRLHPWGLEEDRNRVKEIRPFLSGDSLRNLDRGSSARLGRLMVRDYFSSLDRPVLFLLEMDPEVYPVRGRYQAMETALEGASRGIYRTFLALEKAGVIIHGEVEGPDGFLPQWGKDHTMAMLEALACAKPLGEAAPWEDHDIWKSRLSTSISLVYLGPPPRDELKNLLFSSYTRGHRVDLLLTGSDRHLVFPQGLRWGWLEDVHE